MSEPIMLTNEILDANLAIWRQIHPKHCKLGKITQKAFIPKPKDEGLLSVTNSRLIKKPLCYSIFNEILKFPTCGLGEITVANIHSVPLKTYDDPVDHLTVNENVDCKPFFDAHAVIDMRDLEEDTIEDHSAHLSHIANSNGLYTGSTKSLESQPGN